MHEVLATASLGVALLVGLEGLWRGIRADPPSRLTGTLSGILLVTLGVTGAGGLGLVAGGGRPEEALHFVYAVLALGAIPIASSVTRGATPRQQGLVTAVAAIVALAVIARLFGTG